MEESQQPTEPSTNRDRETPPPTESASSSDRQEPGGTSSGIAAGYILVGAMVVGVAIGLAIDASFGTTPGWTVGCALIFLFAGLYQVVKDAWK